MSATSLVNAVLQEGYGPDKSLLYAARTLSMRNNFDYVPVEVVELVIPHVDDDELKDSYYRLAGLVAQLVLNSNYTKENKTNFGDSLTNLDKKSRDTKPGLLFLHRLNALRPTDFLKSVGPMIVQCGKEDVFVNPYDLAHAVTKDRAAWNKTKQVWAEHYFKVVVRDNDPAPF